MILLRCSTAEIFVIQTDLHYLTKPYLEQECNEIIPDFFKRGLIILNELFQDLHQFLKKFMVGSGEREFVKLAGQDPAIIHRTLQPDSPRPIAA